MDKMIPDNPQSILESLTDKQRAFIEAYTSQAGNRNTTRSAQLAGYNGRNAGRIGARLLQRPDVRSIIDGRLNLTYDAWRQEGIDAYRQLELKSPVRVRYWELVGKSAGWLKDNEVTINHLSVNGDDIMRLRKSLASKGLELEGQPVDSMVISCGQAVDKLCIEGGGVEMVGQPPATPLDMHSTPPQNAQENKEPDGK